jgi:coenzyme F420-reducing hydrogenase gamma subunit
MAAVPAMRNQFTLKDCLDESYLHAGSGWWTRRFPMTRKFRLLLNQVHPMHEVVKIDYFLPGCPPSADAIWTFRQPTAVRSADRAVLYPDSLRLKRGDAMNTLETVAESETICSASPLIR